MPKYDVILKPVKPNQVISIRETLPNYPSVGRLFDELEKYLHLHHQDKPSNYYTAIWHDQGYQEQDVDGEAVIAIENQLVGNERIKVYELPGVETMACVVHHGSYKNLNLAYQGICDWIDENGYKIVGSYREFYIQGGQEQDNETYVTEVQFPVENV